MKRKSTTHTIDDVFNEYLTEKRSVYDNYSCPQITRFLDESGLTVYDDPKEIKKKTWDNYVLSLRETGRSIPGINHDLSSVRTFLNWMFRNGYTERFEIKLLKGQEEMIKFIPDEDIRKLLVCSKKDYTEHRTYVIICFILSTGVRSATLRNIRQDDIQGNKVILRKLKNKSVTTLPLTPQLQSILKEFQSSWELGEWLFPAQNQDQLTKTALNTSLARYCKRRGLKRYSPHQIRHTFARQWIINGGNAFMLQQFLTHSTLAMTRHYVKLFSDDLEKSGFENFVYKLPDRRRKV